MTIPEALTSNEPLIWSTGRGTDVWAMFKSALEGDHTTLQKLLEKDPTLVRAHYDYRTPMCFAVRGNQLKAAALLLEKGASPVNSGTGDTLLQMARDRGYIEMCRLIEKALQGNHHANGAGNSLAAMIRNRNIIGVREALDMDGSIIHARDDSSNQPIHWAVMTRQPDLINMLLDRGAEINAKRADGARPLQLINGDYDYRGWRDVPAETTATPGDIYRLLVKRGAYVDIGMAALTGDIARVRELLDQDPSLVNHMEYVTYYAGSGPAIKNAAQAGHFEIVQLLLERGADPNQPEEGIAPRGRALHEAAVNGHIEIVRLLLDHGAHPNVPVESSADTLSFALEKKDRTLTELLCSYGASREVALLAYYNDIVTAAAVFAADPKKANDAYALECAAGQGHDAFVRLMLRYQPDLATRIAVGVNSQGPQDAIHSKELTEYLFRHGMDASNRNWLSITPLHRFAKHGDTQNAAIFLQHGADINATDEEFHSTPLGYAAKYNQPEMVKFLLQQGADQYLPHDAEWSRPLAWAERRGYTEIIELLTA